MIFGLGFLYGAFDDVKNVRVAGGMIASCALVLIGFVLTQS